MCKINQLNTSDRMLNFAFSKEIAGHNYYVHIPFMSAFFYIYFCNTNKLMTLKGIKKLKTLV